MPRRRTAQFKAWNASNSRAIAKLHNAEIDYFGHNAFIHELIRGSLALLPWQTIKAPAPKCAALVFVIEVAFESLFDVVYAVEAIFDE